MPVNARVLAAVDRRNQQQLVRAQLAARSLGGQNQGRGVQVGPVGQQRAQRQQVQAVQASNNQAWEQAKAKFSQQAKPRGTDGLGGFVGDILSNPVVSTALKPLSVLAYPKNAVIAGLQEVREHNPLPDWTYAFSGVGAPLLLMDKQRAEDDPRNWWEKVKDPEYGFGSTTRQIDTGNDVVDNWGNRGLGLWGDIALDPLTYATAGLNKIPGAAGRISLAAEATKLGLGEEVVRAAGQGGARAVRKLGDEAAVQALRLPEPGIRLGGQLGPRIAGTGPISEGLDALLGAVRRPATDTAFGRGVRRLGSARHPGTRAAVESLATGGSITPTVAAGHILTEWEKAGAARQLTGALENTARDIAKKGKNDAALTHALEAGDLSNPVVAAWDDMNRQVLERQRAAGVSVGELGDEELGYAPRILTKEGKRSFEHPQSNIPGAQGIGPESQQYARAIKKGGTYTIEGKTFAPIEGTIKEANDWSLRELGHKLYEDSPGKLSAYTVEQASDAVGKVAKLAGLVKTGSQKVFGVTDRRVTHIDEALTRAASKATGGELADVLEPILRDITAGTERVGQTGRALSEADDLLAQFSKDAFTAQRNAYGAAYANANEAQSAFDAASLAAPDVSGRLNELVPQLEQARTAEAAAQRPVDQLRDLANSGLQGPQMTSPLVGPQVQRLEDQFQKYADLTKRFLEAGDQGNARQAMLRAKATQEQLTDLTRRYAVPVEGAALPEAEPFQEALQRATGARQSLEEQVGPLQTQQAAHEALGPPPDTDAMVAQQVQPRLQELADAHTTLSYHRNATEMADVMAESALGLSERQLDEAISQLPESAQAMMQVTMKADRSEPAMGKMLSDIRQGKLDDQVVLQANEGFELLRTDRLMGRDVIIDSEMKRVMDESNEAMRNFNAVMNADKGLFGKVVDEYTKFFKAWATATPGFHLRNGLSATFMNMTEGVSFKEMLDGNLIWKTWRRYGGGSELALRSSRRIAPEVDWVSHLPERLQGVAPDVVSAVYASGAGGRYTAAELGERAFGEAGEGGSRIGRVFKKSYENRLTTASHNVGEHVEGRVRSGLALHALGQDGSGSWADAVQRIKRVHFDYSDVNEVDRSLRRVIPFWTFMSRNLPLQVQQMWTAPRAYSHYQSVMRNIDADPQGNLLMPDWLRRSGAVFLNKGGTALAPDIGPSQIDTYLGEIADPKSLLSNVNPLFKNPLQLATNQNFFYGDQYKANDFQKPGIESLPFLPLLSMLGMTQDTAQGPVVERKFLDTIRDLIPLNAQVNRLGSTTADREGKGLASQLGYIGIPVRQVDQAKERRNQGFDAQRKAREQQNLRDALAKFGGAA